MRKMILNNSFSIYHDLKIESSIERVYDAISNPKHLVNWWPLKCDGILKKNEIYNFYFGEEYDWYGKVEKAHKYKSFYIKMINSDQDWNSTSFGFDLEKQESEILLKFRHTDWKNCNNHFRRTSFCWAMLLNGLKNYVENDIIIPFSKRE